MNRATENTRWDWLFTSAVRCHLVGAAVTLTLAGATGWVVTRGDAFWKTLLPSDPTIGLAEAASLIEQQPRWEKREAALRQRRADALARAEVIRRWLPASVDSMVAAREDLETLIGESDLSLLDLEQGDPQQGGRLGVVPVTCRVRGTYPAICQLLKSLATRPQPAWCSGIRIERAPTSPADGAVVPGEPCLATLSLRLPFAAPGTAAGRLLAQDSLP